MTNSLTDGYHYAIVFDKERIIEKKKDLPIPYCEGFCCQNYQYLAPVPSYEELQNQAFILKSRESEIVKKETQRIRLMTKLNDVNNENHALRIENDKLKELLKDCRDEIEYLRKHYKGSIDHLKNNTRLDKEINQVLGEE